MITGFLRIVTNRRIYLAPAPIGVAFDFIAALLSTSPVLDQSARTWTTFGELAAQDRGIFGNVVPDAYLAAVALTHGAQIATRDRGFGRFAGLRWFDPATEPA